MKYLSIDLETYSPLNLSKTGVYPYAAHPDFQILLLGYAIDEQPVQVVDLATGEELPDEIVAALVDPGVFKWAFNASFERICLSSWLHATTQNYYLKAVSRILLSGTAPWRGLPILGCRLA